MLLPHDHPQDMPMSPLVPTPQHPGAGTVVDLTSVSPGIALEESRTDPQRRLVLVLPSQPPALLPITAWHPCLAPTHPQAHCPAHPLTPTRPSPHTSLWTPGLFPAHV